jgi:hypothetical protein
MSDDDDSQQLHASVDQALQEAPLENRGVLNYRSPAPPQAGSRASSIGKAIAAVWGVLGVAGIGAYVGRASEYVFAILLVGTLACLAYSFKDASKNGHTGFFIGLMLGILTVIGVAGLTIAVVCGAFK